MKKFLLSILTIIYMTVSCGVAIDIHYCMGKKAGADLYKTTRSACSKCGMKGSKDGCCRDEQKFYKLADAHKNVLGYSSSGSFFIAAVIPHNAIISTTFYTGRKINLRQSSPPGDTGPAIFIRNCNFRI